jgi:hypothetical protein
MMFAANKLSRAMELAEMINLNRSLPAAIKLVAALRLPALAERLTQMLEKRDPVGLSKGRGVFQSLTNVGR